MNTIADWLLYSRYVYRLGLMMLRIGFERRSYCFQHLKTNQSKNPCHISNSIAHPILLSMVYGSESDLYARLLFSRGRGHPLWIPEPPDDLCEDYRKGGVRIGDVGIVTADGNFDAYSRFVYPQMILSILSAYLLGSNNSSWFQGIF